MKLHNTLTLIILFSLPLVGCAVVSKQSDNEWTNSEWNKMNGNVRGNESGVEEAAIENTVNPNYVFQYENNRAYNVTRAELVSKKEMPIYQGNRVDYLFWNERAVYHERDGIVYRIVGADAATLEIKNILSIFVDKDNVFFLNTKGYFVKSSRVDRTAFEFVSDQDDFGAYFVKDKNHVYRRAGEDDMLPVDGADPATFAVQAFSCGSYSGAGSMCIFASDVDSVWWLDNSGELREIKELDPGSFRVLHFNDKIFLVDNRQVHVFDTMKQRGKYYPIKGIDLGGYTVVYKNVYKNDKGIFYIDPFSRSLRTIVGIDAKSLEFAEEREDGKTYAYVRDKKSVWKYDNELFVFKKIEGAVRDRFGSFTE